MEFNYKYKNLTDRAKQVTIAEGKGLRMLHDNFGKSWKPGDEPHGTMVFTDEPSPPPEPTVDYQAEWDKASTVTERVKVLAKKLGIKVS